MLDAEAAVLSFMATPISFWPELLAPEVLRLPVPAVEAALLNVANPATMKLLAPVVL